MPIATDATGQRVRAHIFLLASTCASLRSYSFRMRCFSDSSRLSFSRLNSCTKHIPGRSSWGGGRLRAAQGRAAPRENASPSAVRQGRTSSADMRISFAFSSASCLMNMTICSICRCTCARARRGSRSALQWSMRRIGRRRHAAAHLALVHGGVYSRGTESTGEVLAREPTAARAACRCHFGAESVTRVRQGVWSGRMQRGDFATHCARSACQRAGAPARGSSRPACPARRRLSATSTPTTPSIFRPLGVYQTAAIDLENAARVPPKTQHGASKAAHLGRAQRLGGAQRTVVLPHYAYVAFKIAMVEVS